MATLKDLMTEEVNDANTAANAAAMGRSLTGLSGKHTLFGDEVKREGFAEADAADRRRARHRAA